MLLPAEASHGVLVARESKGGGNITTVTAVRPLSQDLYHIGG
jgi:hypothetical protein